MTLVRIGDRRLVEVDTGRTMGCRRVFLVGCPRSRTTVAQTVFSLAFALESISTNWWLTGSSTRLLNGPEGESREVTRPFARRRVAARLAERGVRLSEGFGVQEALDRLAAESGAPGWLEKTPLHVLAVDEIEAEVAGARFVHLVRDPQEVVASFLRRAAENPDMRGASWQSDQAHCEAIWRACVGASLQHQGRANHLLIDSGAFVMDSEATAQRVATFVNTAYRPSDDPARVAAASHLKASERVWKQEAVGPVRQIEHPMRPNVGPLEAETSQLWARVQALMNRAETPVVPGREGSD